MTESVPALQVPTVARLRVAAYVLCVRDDQLLLARYVARGEPHWTLPGGRLEHGEHPYDAAVREVEEETRAAFVDVALAYLDAQPANGLIPAARDIVAAPDNIARPEGAAPAQSGAA